MQIVNGLQYALPRDAVLHHSHNEGMRSKADAGRAKAMGQRAGFSDLIIFWRGIVVMLEVKTRSGRQSAAQLQFAADMSQTMFHEYHVVRSYEDAVLACFTAGIPTKNVGNAQHTFTEGTAPL